MEFLFNTFEPHQPRHRTWSTWLFLNPFFTFHISALVIPSLSAVVQWGNMLVFSATWGFPQRRSGRHPGPDPSPPTGKQLCSQEQALGTRKIIPCPRGQDTQNYSGKIGLWHFPLFRMLISLFSEQSLARAYRHGLAFFLRATRKNAKEHHWPSNEDPRGWSLRGWSATWLPPFWASVSSSVKEGGCYPIPNIISCLTFNDHIGQCYVTRAFVSLWLQYKYTKECTPLFNFETHLYAWNFIPLSTGILPTIHSFILSFNKCLCQICINQIYQMY